MRYIAAVIKTHQEFRESPEKYWGRIEQAIGIDGTVLRNVWAEHRWRGGLAEGLEEVLVEEEGWVAGKDRRRATSVEDLGKLVDRSVLDEARLLLA